ncbi:MAG: late competence development ComFB family protein [Oscillospiraceae bacterium]|jgi:competence protein ComFB|nr:late competence development ComFB family protein [Oscillospiraceae bacterium]
MCDYKNIMEDMVEQVYDKIKDQLDCCQCQCCRNDIIAYALNQLPPHYVVSHEGKLYAKMYLMKEQHSMDITSALTKGAMLVREHPRH